MRPALRNCKVDGLCSVRSSREINIHAFIWSLPATSVAMFATLASSPMLAIVIEALSHSYEHVVIDRLRLDVAAERFVSLATHAMLVAADPVSVVTRTVRDRLLQTGFSDVAVISGGAQAVAA